MRLTYFKNEIEPAKYTLDKNKWKSEEYKPIPELFWIVIDDRYHDTPYLFLTRHSKKIGILKWIQVPGANVHKYVDLNDQMTAYSSGYRNGWKIESDFLLPWINDNEVIFFSTFCKNCNPNEVYTYDDFLSIYDKTHSAFIDKQPTTREETSTLIQDCHKSYVKSRN